MRLTLSAPCVSRVGDVSRTRFDNPAVVGTLSLPMHYTNLSIIYFIYTISTVGSLALVNYVIRCIECML